MKFRICFKPTHGVDMFILIYKLAIPTYTLDSVAGSMCLRKLYILAVFKILIGFLMYSSSSYQQYINVKSISMLGWRANFEWHIMEYCSKFSKQIINVLR